MERQKLSQARKDKNMSGEVESACDCARQIITIANTKAPIRQRLWIVRTLLKPYADVAEVKDLDREIRMVL